jgi:hypothetical protein
MRSKAGFFTLGVLPSDYNLPHPSLSLPVILLIRRVVCVAFNLLREANHPLSLLTEDQVTAKLRAIIESRLRQTGEVPGFNDQFYECVTRQTATANFDGRKLNKCPDLCFRLRNENNLKRKVLSEYDSLFVECKPVDAKHPVGSKYCDDGLVRFVLGDYAWAMQDAMMIAYARDGRTISGHLIPAMKERSRIKRLRTFQLPKPHKRSSKGPSDEAETVHISKHRRRFFWPDKKGRATDITVYHSWHNCG